ncbi:low molecular weight protein-tyrosine-phosphatase [Haloactinopolyspora sp.]|uniref:low molecular weight protein-tyrosine-phosphatase n=1 Tax=Haloactinopolyspora sp. TaxID=1966353 RepID=UPI0026235E41|nr:low molecular weight protein-tyrosine-phosphatase [Haloactinopolyspora sp.]
MSDSLPHLRLCMVCAGNICRSPIAAVVLRDHLERAGLADVVTVDSAGTGNWHAGQPADPRTVAVLHRHGYDGTAHRAQQFQPDWFDTYDLVLVMDRDNFADLHRLAPDEETRAKIQMLRAYDPEALADGELDVPDPYLGDDQSFEDVVDMVEKAVSGLVDAIRDDLGVKAEPEGGERGRH